MGGGGGPTFGTLGVVRWIDAGTVGLGILTGLLIDAGGIFMLVCWGGGGGTIPLMKLARPDRGLAEGGGGITGAGIGAARIF